jgi:methylenetetrahydrofolate dehydrogenase (NADP+) / methenyltetrahydrofolate cyclohydrolase
MIITISPIIFLKKNSVKINMIVNTSIITQNLENRLKKQIIKNKFKLIIVIIGNSLASTKYANLKLRKGKELGIEVKILHFKETDNYQDIISTINIELDAIKPIGNKVGLIFQLPIKNQVLRKNLLQDKLWTDNSLIDVDFLAKNSMLKFNINQLPPTIGAIDEVFKYLNVENLHGKTVALIGQGELVGKNLIKYLLEKEATILTFNQYSTDIQYFCKKADIIVSAVGKPKLVDYNFLNPNGQIIIDSATSDENGQLVGDLNLDDIIKFINENNLNEKFKIVKSPGGIGPITVLKLFENLLLM